MMKFKNIRNIDARQSMLVDSAYYQCNPPQHSALKRKKRPVVQDWMRHLVFVQLGKDDVRKVSHTQKQPHPCLLQPLMQAPAKYLSTRQSSVACMSVVKLLPIENIAFPCVCQTAQVLSSQIIDAFERY